LGLDQKQRLQLVLFPKGITFFDGIIGTAEISLIHSLISDSGSEKANLANLNCLWTEGRVVEGFTGGENDSRE
jgi:hypothetical protein